MVDMYWRNNTDSSKIENLLSTQDVTLKDVLNEDGVINEVQVYNEKLLNYLITPDHISEMLNILIAKPQPNEDGVLFFTEQNVVSEILSSYVNVIYSTLSNNPDYLLILFKPFMKTEISDDESQEPINSVTCSLIFKVAKVLCQQSSEKLLNFLMSSDGILDQLVKNIESNSVSEFLIKCIQSFQPNDVLINYLKWLSKEDITGKLLANVQPSSDIELCNKSIQCMIELLSAVKSSKVENSLHSDLQSTRVVTHILSMMLSVSANRMSMICSGLEFIKSIFEIPEKQSLSSFASPIYQTYKKSSINSQDILENPNLYNPIIDCLVIKLVDFKIILEDTSELSKIRIPTAYGGEIVGPLGPHRLALIDLIHHLVLLEQNRIYYEIINSDIIPTLLNLFFEFHLNTFLHRFVTEIINKLIAYASQTYTINESSNSINNISHNILHEIIIKQDILTKITVTWNKNMTAVNGTSMMIRNTHRPFLKEIANTIEKHIHIFRGIISLETLSSWKAFTESYLAEENRKNAIKKNINNMVSYHDSSSDGEGAIEAIEDIDNEDTLKIYEDCIQQEMTYTFPDYNYKPIFLQEKNSLESEFNSNPLTDFFISTQEDIENAENFEAICNVMLTTKMPCDAYVEPNESVNNEMDFSLSDVENIEDIYESNYKKTSNIQTNIIDNIFREAYKELNQPAKHHEIKIIDNRSSVNKQEETTNNRFQFRTSTGLPSTTKHRQTWSSNSLKVEKMGDNIIVNSTIVPRLKFGNGNEKKENSKSVFVSSHITRALSDDKETQRGSPFSIDEEDEMPLCSTARYIPNEKSTEFSDESDDDDLPLSSRLEKGHIKLSENLSQLDSQLDDKTWSNPSNNESVNTDDVELEFDTVQDVTPDLVLTHCNTTAITIVNCTDNDKTESSISEINCIRSVNESNIKSDEPDSVANIELYEIENPFSPKLVRHSILSTNKDTGLNKTKLFESSKCLTLSSNNKSNKNIDSKSSSTLSSRHTFSSILCPLPWTSFQKVNRSISAPIKLNINNDTAISSFHNPEITKGLPLVNGMDESNSTNQNPLD